MQAMTLPARGQPARSASFAATAEEHLDDVYGYLVYLTRDRSLAEDLAADTFEKALRTWRRFDPRRGSAKTWLFQIARTTALDWFRAEERRHRREERAAAPEAGRGRAARGPLARARGRPRRAVGRRARGDRTARPARARRGRGGTCPRHQPDGGLHPPVPRPPEARTEGGRPCLSSSSPSSAPRSPPHRPPCGSGCARSPPRSRPPSPFSPASRASGRAGRRCSSPRPRRSRSRWPPGTVIGLTAGRPRPARRRAGRLRRRHCDPGRRSRVRRPTTPRRTPPRPSAAARASSLRIPGSCSATRPS